MTPNGVKKNLLLLQRSCFAGMAPTNTMRGHLETTDHTITLVDKVRDMVREMVTGLSTKAVETAATKAERGKAAAVPETRRTGELLLSSTAVIYSTHKSSAVCTRSQYGHNAMLTACASGLTLL